MPSNLTRGIVAGLAGYARAKIALAQEEREDQRALLDAELRKREFDLKERLGLGGLDIQREQIAATERSTAASQQLARDLATEQTSRAINLQKLQGNQALVLQKVLGGQALEQGEQEIFGQALNTILGGDIQKEIAQIADSGATKRVEAQATSAEKIAGMEIASQEKIAQFSARANQALLQLKLAQSDPESLETNQKLTSSLRNEYMKLQQVKDFDKVRSAYGRILAAFEDDSGPADLAMIFNFMKMLDPGSTVREGEFATAENATGVSEQIRNLYNRVLTGRRLGQRGSPTRDEFLDQARTQFNMTLSIMQPLNNEYKRLATQYGVASENVVFESAERAPQINLGIFSAHQALWGDLVKGIIQEQSLGKSDRDIRTRLLSSLQKMELSPTVADVIADTLFGMAMDSDTGEPGEQLELNFNPPQTEATSTNGSTPPPQGGSVQSSNEARVN